MRCRFAIFIPWDYRTGARTTVILIIQTQQNDQMKFFIDTANLNEIKEAHDLGVLDGVTTNPSLMAKEGIKGKENIRAHYKAICNIVDNNVSAEVIATDFEGIYKEGRELARIDDKIVVKVPMIKDGVKAIKKFSSENIRTNCTLVFSAGQAILAAKAGQVMFLLLSVVLTSRNRWT